MSNYSSEKIEKQEQLSFDGCKDLLVKLVEDKGFSVMWMKRTVKLNHIDYWMPCKDKEGKTHFFLWEQKCRTSTEENRKRYRSSELKVKKKGWIYQHVGEFMKRLKDKGISVPRQQIHVYYIQMLYKDGPTIDFTDSYNKHDKIFDGVSWDKMMIYNLDSIKWNELGVSVRPQRQTQYNDYSRMQIDEIYQIPYSKGLCYDKESDKLCRI